MRHQGDGTLLASAARQLLGRKVAAVMAPGSAPAAMRVEDIASLTGRQVASEDPSSCSSLTSRAVRRERSDGGPRRAPAPSTMVVPPVYEPLRASDGQLHEVDSPDGYFMLH
jgi:hypothetical protein